MPVTLEQFAKLLTDSGIMSVDDLGAFHERLDPKPTDAQSLAKELVRKKKLTKFQATQAYQGKGKALVFGEYVVLDKIGEGGMGQVYKAQHRRMKRVVAIKVLPSQAVDSPDAVKRFEREVEAAAKLIHPNVVSAFDAGEAHGNYFLVMEYVAGKDLSVLLKKNGPLPVEKAVNYTVQAARGLQFAHSKGVVHRDMKPANLLLDSQGTVKILDMGLASFTESVDGNDATADRGLTQSGQIMGTVDYMAPEQAQDTKDADERSDIYSLGCTLYRLLTDKPVFTGSTLINTLVAHREAEIPSLCGMRDDVSAKLDSIYQRMLAKNPEDRYQTMSEVIVDLEALGTSSGSSPALVGEASPERALAGFLQGTAGSASTAQGKTTQRKAAPTRQVPSVSKQAALSKQKKWLAIGGGVLGVLALLGMAFALLPGGDKQDDSAKELTAVATSIDPDRAAAEWVLGIGGNIETDAGFIDSSSKLPDRSFSIQHVGLRINRHVSADNHILIHLQKLDSLNSLDLLRSGLKDVGVEHLKGLASLKSIDLSYNPLITDAGVVHLRSMTQLGNLNLNHTQITDVGISHLKGLTNLTVLGVGGTKVSDDGLRLIKDMSKLEQLYLGSTNITDAGIAHLEEVTSLTRLILNETRITDLCIPHLKRLSKLATLEIRGTQVTAQGIADLKKALPNCEITGP